jgi:DNA-binding transcriptional MerR regulator
MEPAAGRRRYGPAEARQLHQIIALRGFGLPLAEIARLLEGEVTAGQFVELIERMITVDRKLTREQLDQMTEQRNQMTARLTPEELARLRKQREEQVSKLTAEQLAELQQQRQQLLPDDFPEAGAG